MVSVGKMFDKTFSEASPSRRVVLEHMAKNYADGKITEEELRCVVHVMGYDVKFEELRTTAKVHCMEVYINKVVPYADDLDDGDIEDLATTINEWIGNQFWIDEDGDWYDDGRLI